MLDIWVYSHLDLIQRVSIKSYILLLSIYRIYFCRLFRSEIIAGPFVCSHYLFGLDT